MPLVPSKASLTSLAKLITPVLLGMSGYILVALSHETWQPFFEHVLPAMSRSWLLLLLLLSLLANLGLCSWFIAAQGSRIADDYDLLNGRGFYRHKKRQKEYVCGACMAVDRVSPLAIDVDEYGAWWACSFPDCKARYERLEKENG